MQQGNQHNVEQMEGVLGNTVTKQDVKEPKKQTEIRKHGSIIGWKSYNKGNKQIKENLITKGGEAELLMNFLKWEAKQEFKNECLMRGKKPSSGSFPGGGQGNASQIPENLALVKVSSSINVMLQREKNEFQNCTHCCMEHTHFLYVGKTRQC